MTEAITQDEYDKHYQQAFNWQQRRHDQWKENYELYRDLVIVNRLLQRQSVNIPLMKTTVRTLLSKLKKFVDLVFEDRGNDKQKDIFKNAYWEDTVRRCRLKIKDIANKKQVMFYGRTFWKLGVTNGAFWAEVGDPQDFLIDRYADPADPLPGPDTEGTANCVIHQHIYQTFEQIEANEAYDRSAVSALKEHFGTQAGVIQSEQNSQALSDRNQRMEDLGVPDVQSPALGQTIAELKEYYVKRQKDGKVEWRLVTKAAHIKLSDKPMMEVLGVNFPPILTWAEDIERTDMWSDGIADIIRTINKVLNVFFSQLIENRTLRNFGMNYYDATANPEWQPTTMEARPFGWYPLPGKPGDVFQKVEIPDLSESLDEMSFLITMAEQATAATATQKGTSESTEQTLGEVKMMLVESQDRIADMAEPYEQSWLQFGEMWSAIVEANADNLKPVKLYRKSYKGNVFEQEVSPSDWKSESGYGCVVKSAADTDKDAINSLQKFLAVKAQMPMNLPLKKIVDNKLLDLLKLTPEETKEVLQYEEQLLLQAQQMMPGAATPPSSLPPGASPKPEFAAKPQLTPQMNAAPVPAR